MKFFSKIPLRNILIVPFLLQIVTVVGFIGYLSYKNGQQAVEDLANQLMEQVGERISDRLDSYLHVPQQVVAANHLAWQQGTLDITDLEKVRQHLWQQIELNSSITGIHYLNQGGETVGYGRILSQDMRKVFRKVSGKDLPRDTIYYSEAKNPDPRQRKFYIADSRGRAQKLVYPLKMNFRILPWYVQARASHEQAWTPLVIYQVTPALGMFAVAPVYDRANQLQAVFAANVNLADFSTFLKKLNFSPSAQAFIIDRSGNLAATSTLEKLYIEQANTQLTPLPSFKSRNIRTREISQQVEQQFGGFQNLLNTQQLSVISQGEKLFVRVISYQDKYGLDWLIVVAIPESDFMAKIHQNNHFTILLCIVTLLVATGIGLLAARSIAKPILRLNAAAKKLTEGEFEGDLPLEGAKEVGELTDSFNCMAKVLIDYNRTLEARVKERTEALQRSEAQINAFFSSASVGMVIVDRQLQVVKVNQVLGAMDGLALEEQIGKTIGEVVPKLADKIEPLYEQVLATGQPIINRELSVKNPSLPGIEHYSLASYFPIFGGDNFTDGVGAVVVDITDRKHLEIALQEKTDELEGFFSAALDLLCIADTDGYFRRLNAEWQNILGYSLAELEGCRFLDFVHPEDLKSTLNAIAELSKQQVVLNFTNRYRHRDGSYRWIEWRSLPIGKLIYATARDITDRKKTETALRQSEERFQEIARTIDQLFFARSISTGEFLYVNPAYEKIWGRSCESLYQDPQSWEAAVHPDDRLLVQSSVQQQFEGKPVKRGYRIIRPDGEIRWIEAEISVVYDEAGNPQRLVGFAEDISDRKWAEKTLRQSESALAEAQKIAHLGSWSFDAITQKITWSEEMFRIFGRDSAQGEPCYDELIGQTYPDDLEKLLGNIELALTQGKNYEHEIRIVLPDGVMRYTFSKTEVVTNELGQVVKLFGIVQDISDRKKVQAELSQAKEAAEAANRAKSTFLANMSHELRTPLNAILGFAQLLDQSPTLPVEHRDNIAIINQSGQHLLTLIDDVLDMAKIEAGRVSLNEQNFNLHRLLDDIERMFSLRAKEKGLQLIIQRDYAVPEYIRTDEIKLRQVLINLISNGIKFTEAGNVSVKVSLNAQNVPFLILKWEVKDTGIGIYEDELDRIFEPFLQTRTGKQSQEGTGLGLSISRKFVQLMGGEISVKSQVGIGSIFQFDIQISLVEPFNPNTTYLPTPRPLALAHPVEHILNYPNLAALPTDLVERLEQATIRASWEQIHYTLDEIRVVNWQLAETLKQLVANFDYGNILTAIEISKKINKENYKN